MVDDIVVTGQMHFLDALVGAWDGRGDVRGRPGLANRRATRSLTKELASNTRDSFFQPCISALARHYSIARPISVCQCWTGGYCAMGVILGISSERCRTSSVTWARGVGILAESFEMSVTSVLNGQLS